MAANVRRATHPAPLEQFGTSVPHPPRETARRPRLCDTSPRGGEAKKEDSNLISDPQDESKSASARFCDSLLLVLGAGVTSA